MLTPEASRSDLSSRLPAGGLSLELLCEPPPQGNRSSVSLLLGAAGYHWEADLPGVESRMRPGASQLPTSMRSFLRSRENCRK